MRRRLAIVAIGVAVAIGLSQVVAASAGASGRLMCTGYAACAADGKSNSGYKQASGTEYWRMTSGHNCTNYAAYRMIEAGHASDRPWSGNGNALAWGTENADITDKVPKVGSIAWWNAGAHGAGALGHVSYVERVVSSTRIVVSEDNYGGDFHWRIVDKSNGDWPTGFIHFKDAAKSSSFPAYRARTLAQTVSTDTGKSRPLSAATIKPGSSAYVTMTFRNTGDTAWSGLRLRSSSARSPLAAAWDSPNSPTAQKQSAVITGAVATFGFFVTIPAGVPDGTRYPVTFSVVDPAGNTVAKSSTPVTFTADSRDPFSVQPALAIAGPASGKVAREGQVLSAVSGAWAPVQPTLTYQWSRNGVAIPGATQATRRLRSGDVGKTISLAVHAEAPGRLPVDRSASWPTTIRSKYSNTLAIKHKLATKDQLVSANGRYKLVIGVRGSLVLVNRFTNKKVWNSKAYAKKAYTRLRRDGVLVEYSAKGKAIWRSPNSKKAVRAVVTNSGKLVLYTKTGKQAWKTK